MAMNDPQTALSWNNKSVEVSRRLGPDGQVILIWRLLDLVFTTMWELNDYRQALAPFAEAETLLQKLGPENYPGLRAGIASSHAHLANQQGKHQDAIAYAREAIQIAEKLGWVEYIWELVYIGDAYTGLGEYEQARNCYLEALHQTDQMEDLRRPFVLHHLGMVDFYQGNLKRALEYSQAGLQQAYEIPDNNNIAICLGLAARILAKQGLPAQAAHLSGAAHAFHERQGRLSWEDSALDAILPGWEARPDRDAICQAYEEGRAMSADQAVDFALNRL
jgi:tetratricopeptide (TPR) repeat protein